MKKAWLLVLLWCCGALAEPLAGPSDLVYRNGQLVVAEFAAGRLHGLDGCPKGLHPWSLAEGDGAYWLADPLSDRVGRLDAAGWTEFELEVRAPTALAFAGGRLFLAEKFGRVLELDPRSGAVRKVVAFGLDGVGDLAVGDGELFVSLPNQGSVERIPLDGSGQSELAAGLNTPLGLVAEPGHQVANIQVFVPPDPTDPRASEVAAEAVRRARARIPGRLAANFVRSAMLTPASA